MKMAIATPMLHLDLMGEGNLIFVLAQWYRNNEAYRNYCLQKKSEGLTIMVDNGAGDFSFSTTDDDLIEIVKELKPHYIIPRDILFDVKQTVANLEIFEARMQSEGLYEHTSILAVPQGSTQEEWLECYQYMINDPFVSMIGFSKIAIPKAFRNATDDVAITESRIECLELLHAEDNLSKPIHLLGASDIKEFEYYKTRPAILAHIYSFDSCIPVLAGYMGLDMKDPSFVRPKTPHEYFTFQLDEWQKIKALSNIRLIQSIVYE